MRRAFIVSVCFAFAGCAGTKQISNGNEDDDGDFTELLAQTNGKVEQFQYVPDGGRLGGGTSRSYDRRLGNSARQSARLL